MVILHIGEYVKGGVATYLREILNYQVNVPCFTSVNLLMANTNSEDIRIPKLNTYRYNYKRSIFYIILAVCQIYKYIKKIKPDIIHVHSTFAGVFVRILFFIVPSKTKIIYCAHGWSFLMRVNYVKKLFYAFIEKLFAYKTDLIINISQNEFNESIKYGLPREKSITIYNGLSEPNKKHTNSQNIIFDAEKINILFVGRFDRSKGIDILLHIYKSLRLPNIRLILIGENVLKDVKIDIPHGVVNLGWVDHDEIDAYYQLCDAVIIPSRWEGFGFVAIEAMRNKRAVIASNVGALPEIVKDGINGYIFDINNINTLYSILVNLDRSVLRKMGENGYKIYKQKFTSTIMNKKITEQYLKLMSKR